MTMITRSQLSPLPEYFDRYITIVDDVTVTKALEISLNELSQAPLKKWEALGNKAYAHGKWTIKDIIQHVIDAERVFSYRALSFARGEQKVMPFDEQLYGQTAEAVNRTVQDLMEELITVRQASSLLYKSFDAHKLNKRGMGFKGEYSVHDIGFIIAGHQRWHLNIINERYLPLL